MMDLNLIFTIKGNIFAFNETQYIEPYVKLIIEKEKMDFCGQMAGVITNKLCQIKK